MSDRTHTLLATLGGQPQIVTFTLDLLLLKQFPISEVIVLHPAPTTTRLQRALARLQDAFNSTYYASSISFRSHVLKQQGQPIDDIDDDFRADGTLDTIHQLIGDLKRQQRHIHLSISGGRRLMSLLALSVATLNFDRHDAIWHLYTPEALKGQVEEGRQMHLPVDAGIKLIQAPFLPLGTYLYHSSSIFHIAQQEQRAQVEAHERARCQRVMQEATPAQRKVLQAFGQGLRPEEVADQLSLSVTTVRNHRTDLLQLCRNAWNLPPDEPLSYHFLQARFAPYFNHLP